MIPSSPLPKFDWSAPSAKRPATARSIAARVAGSGLFWGALSATLMLGACASILVSEFVPWTPFWALLVASWLASMVGRLVAPRPHRRGASGGGGAGGDGDGGGGGGDGGC